MTLPQKIEFEGFALENPSNLNIIIGRNGAGKSRFLRGLSNLRHDSAYFISYISPERAGSFEPDPNFEVNQRQDKNWVENTRIKNQADGFKKASANKLRELAMRFANRMEIDLSLRLDINKTFATEQLSKINKMLSNIRIDKEAGNEFVFKTNANELIKANDLSSGESEIIALSTEILHFFELCSKEKINILLLDEPDVHLHPDLQSKLARFIVEEITALTDEVRDQVTVCISTHSTPLICELALFEKCSIGIKEFDLNTIIAKPISDQLKKLAPFFGHPLSKCLSNDIPLIIEGEDDERVWQQASRSSKGLLKVFPTLSLSVQKQTELETSCDKLMTGIYDAPRAISIRDGDDKRGNLLSIGCVERFRLQCYSIENLLTTDEVLESLGGNWNDLKTKGLEWCKNNPKNIYVNEFEEFLESPDRYKDTKIKNIAQLIPAVMGFLKPWEFYVGQVIGKINRSSSQTNPHGIVNYVGISALNALGLINKP